MTDARPSPSPLLSVGMPVYNGAETIEAAIRSVLAQRGVDIEIIISDNASQDGTEAVCRRLAEADPRIRYIRQPQTTSIVENFRFVVNEAHAPFFMWAAHDDVRDPDFASPLIAALEANSKAILAFGDLVEVRDGRETPWLLDFTTTGMSRSRRLWTVAMRQLYDLYGVWRTDALARVEWWSNDWWCDTPLMMAASMHGDFIRVPGPRLVYRFNPRPFFGWREKAGETGFANDMRQFGKKTADLLRTIHLSAASVNRAAGPFRGFEAGVYASCKILGQIGGFLWRRRPGGAGPQ